MNYPHKSAARIVAVLFIAITTAAILPGADQKLHPDPDPPQYIQKALQWLVTAQYDNGGWGAGMHSSQHITDPHQVQIDPATTAFATLALIRSGNGLDYGIYQKNVRKALMLMLEIVENSSDDDERITNIQGTQPQVKLGQNIDASMAAQLFTRVLPMTENQPALYNRVAAALEKCLHKLERAQNVDGSTANGGWAGVLQSAMTTSAFESAKAAGADVDDEVLRRAREYQQNNIDVKSGGVRTEDAAGISLYAVSASQKAAAPAALEAKNRIDKAKKDGRLEQDAAISKENLQKAVGSEEEAEALYDAYRQNEIALEMLNDDSVLAGFGNNGGEEFLSYMMTSESLATTDVDEWKTWTTKMDDRFRRIQNPDGSWSGHHCITSPVFSTAAVILTVMVDTNNA
ncbi:MAG: terpene cyclase/mutase family protein [Rhodothermales bacterium]|nr:terpene cyclase/mutase family protein [Rhodothermales bacterium]